MLQNEFTYLIDGVNAVQVAIALRHSPGEQSVAAKNEAIRDRIILDGPFNQEPQFESGTLPGHPHDLAIKFLVEFLELPFSICACRDSDGPVRVQMVHVRKRKEC